jgi:hypothetical protein
MKKLLICILCFASVRSFAQLRLGVQGSFSSINFWQTDGYTGLSANQWTEQLNAFQGGIFAEYDLGYSGVVLQPALMYALNGSHLTQNQSLPQIGNFQVGKTDTKLQYYSARFPLNILYAYRIDPKIKVFAGLGPYIAYTLSGTEKGTATGSAESGGSFVYQTSHIDNKVKVSSDASSAALGVSNVAPIDIGMDILLGVQYKKLQISASWNRGFSRMYHTDYGTYHSSYTNMGNQFWNFTLGYLLFGHERKPKL